MFIGTLSFIFILQTSLRSTNFLFRIALYNTKLCFAY